LRTRGSKYGGKSGDKAWLLIKENDRYARPGGRSIVETAAKSVTTGRSMKEIAAARSNVWESKLSVEENVKAGAIAPAKKKARAKAPADTKATKGNGATATPKNVSGAKAAKTPSTLLPTLATLVGSAPTGDDWLHEIKYDGYRMLCRIEKGKARLVSRNGKDWTAVFASVADDLAKLPVREAWIDGEVRRCRTH
jgi:bifunctional non-homologous end joining protein LigD